ncbi:hypothetical protein NQ315_006193 [Exocentrus adspersus]|uniref:Histidine-rich glycoprotein-like n=1 Tax=Exocentrus adspersus TaxID=1586481 RepID=A0AAV8W002_9CUCU|nr:hypothetical protein NQ315_006193 [Exocentrus adspersus]
MAQFVTHIQPTLVESSHHHPPHGHHHKDHHHAKDHHHYHHQSDKTHFVIKSPNRLERPHELHYKESHSEVHHHKETHLSHSRDYPVLPHTPTPAEHHHQDVEVYHGEHKRNSGHYTDSHGVLHPYDIHFVDSQGIYRDYQGHGVNEEDGEKERRRKSKSLEKSPMEGGRPTPPQFIDIQPVHGENKQVGRVD